jgi:NhaP-type Na+/H+ or K+/H+ antiporter
VLTLLVALDIIDGSGEIVAEALVSLAWVCGFAMLMGFLNQLARQVTVPSVGRDAENLMTFGVAYYFGLFAAGLAARFFGCMSLLILVALIYYGLKFLILYVRLLNYMRESIELRL